MRKLSFCIILLISILCSCGPRNASLAQEILGKWEMNASKEPFKDPLNWIKFHTNHTFDAVIRNDVEIAGDWATSDTTKSILLTIKEYPLLNGKWMIDLQKDQLVLTSETGDTEYTLSKN